MDLSNVVDNTDNSSTSSFEDVPTRPTSKNSDVSDEEDTIKELEGRNEELLDANEKLKITILDLERELEYIRNSRDQHRNARVQDKELINSLKYELEKSKKGLFEECRILREHFESQLAEQVKKCEDLEVELMYAEKKKKLLTDAALHFERSLYDEKQMHEELKFEKDDVEKSLEDMKEEVEKLEKRVEDMVDRSEEQENYISRLQDELRDERTRREELEAQLGDEEEEEIYSQTRQERDEEMSRYLHDFLDVEGKIDEHKSVSEDWIEALKEQNRQLLDDLVFD